MCKLLDAAIARGEQGALQKLGADAVALPGPLDAEGGFGLTRVRAERPQLRYTAQHAIGQEAVDHVFRFERAARHGGG